jgi:hypothetical protein
LREDPWFFSVYPSYVSFGDSLDANLSLPVGSVSATFNPNDTFIGGDGTSSGADLLITSARLLARRQVTAVTTLPLALGDTFAITLEPSTNSSFLDSSLKPIAFRSQPGTASVVPEPASFVLLCTGELRLWALRRRLSHRQGAGCL